MKPNLKLETDTNQLIGAVFEWDISNWSRALTLWEQAILPSAAPGMSALEIGSRRGGLSLYLALKGYQVVCSDVESPEPLARRFHEMHQVDNLITDHAADASCLPFPDNSFDVVAFKSVLGAVGRQGNDYQIERALNEFRRVLKAGGILLFAENLAASRIHRFLRRRFISWG